MDMTRFGFRADYDQNNRIVKQEDVRIGDEYYHVSTVDLGLDHSFGGGEPLYFETMVFPKGTFDDLYCERYNNREQAEQAHIKLIDDIKVGKYKVEDGSLVGVLNG